MLSRLAYHCSGVEPLSELRGAKRAARKAEHKTEFAARKAEHSAERGARKEGKTEKIRKRGL